MERRANEKGLLTKREVQDPSDCEEVQSVPLARGIDGGSSTPISGPKILRKAIAWRVCKHAN